MSLDSVNCFVGLDVGRETMEALWIDEKGEKINSMGFSNNHEGYEEFIEKLSALNQKGFSPVVGWRVTPEN